MIPYKLIGASPEDSISLDFPTRWQDLKYSTFLKLYTDWANDDPDDLLKLLTILTGVPYEIWYNAVGDVNKDILPRLDFLKDAPAIELEPVPTEIKIGDKVVKVPKEINTETYGQYLTLRKAAAKASGTENDLLKVIPTAVAVYTYCQYYETKKIDENKLKEYIETISELPLYDVYPLGRFFFLKFISSPTESIRPLAANIAAYNAPLV